MNALAWILALTAATRVLLVDEVYSIPADQWRYVEVGLKRQPALVVTHYDVRDGSAVAVALMRRDDMENLRQGLPHGVVQAIGPGGDGTLRAQVAAGDYVIVVDNRSSGGHAASVHLRVWLDFSSAPAVTGLSRERQVAVIFISLAVFFGIIAYAVGKLRNAAKQGGGG
jgi:hypothetical protein